MANARASQIAAGAAVVLVLVFILYNQQTPQGKKTIDLSDESLSTKETQSSCQPCVCPAPVHTRLHAEVEATKSRESELKKQEQRAFCESRPSMPGVIPKVMTMANKPVKMFFISGLGGERDIVSVIALDSGEWETFHVNEIIGKLDAARAAGNKDPVFLDIGSNIGWFSIQAAVRGFRVYSFDAMRRNGNIFRSTMCENPEAMEKITFYNVALSNEERLCIVSSDPSNVGNGQIECGETNTNRPTNTKYPGNVVREAVDMVRLDKYVHEPIEVLKIDVEGHELLALQGGGDLFAKGQVKYLTSEISSIREPDGQLLQQLQTWGFQCSVSSFKGPFLYFNKGQELADLQKVVGGPTGGNPMALLSVFCKHKSA